jgi:hypothetical protein
MFMLRYRSLMIIRKRAGDETRCIAKQQEYAIGDRFGTLAFFMIDPILRPASSASRRTANA